VVLDKPEDVYTNSEDLVDFTHFQSCAIECDLSRIHYRIFRNIQVVILEREEEITRIEPNSSRLCCVSALRNM
jgi:hypothetical protein